MVPVFEIRIDQAQSGPGEFETDVSFNLWISNGQPLRHPGFTARPGGSRPELRETAQGAPDGLNLGDPLLEPPPAVRLLDETVTVSTEESQSRLALELHECDEVRVADRAVSVDCYERVDDHVFVPVIGSACVLSDEGCKFLVPFDAASEGIRWLTVDEEHAVGSEAVDPSRLVSVVNRVGIRSEVLDDCVLVFDAAQARLKVGNRRCHLATCCDGGFLSTPHRAGSLLREVVDQRVRWEGALSLTCR